MATFNGPRARCWRGDVDKGGGARRAPPPRPGPRPPQPPADSSGRSAAIEWLFAALNSVEMARLPWSLLIFTGNTGATPAWTLFDGFLHQHRLTHLEPCLFYTSPSPRDRTRSRMPSSA